MTLRVWKIVAPAIDAWMVFVGDADAVEAERARQAKKYQRVTRLEELHPSAPEWREAARSAGLSAGPPCTRFTDDAEADARREAEAQLQIVLSEAERAGAVERLAEALRKVMGRHRVWLGGSSALAPYIANPEVFTNAGAPSLGTQDQAYVWPSWSAAVAWIDQAQRAAAAEGAALAPVLHAEAV